MAEASVWRHWNVQNPAPAGPADHLTPEALYERHWALTLLADTLSELEREADSGGGRSQFEILRPLLTAEEGSDKTIAAQLQLTEGAARVAVHRLRRRFAQLLRARIGETADSIEAIDDELRQLMSAVAVSG